MYCPFCQAEDTKVIDSRLVQDGYQIRRRRSCAACQARFTTYEQAELWMPKVIKRSGHRDNFSETSLRAGMLRALEKRPVSVDQLESVIVDIKTRLLRLGEREVSSQLLGEWVMEALKGLDEVAYIRFASVYRCFQDLHAFHEAISNIQDTALSNDNNADEQHTPQSKGEPPHEQ